MRRATPKTSACGCGSTVSYRQNGSTRNMIFGVDYLVWYLSQFMTLYPAT